MYFNFYLRVTHLTNPFLSATIPPRIFRQRNITFSMLVATLISLGVNTHTFYLPFYFQSAKGTTSASSGLRLLPYLISVTLAELIVGSAVTALGVYLPFMWFGTILFTIAASLLCTLTVSTSTAILIGYQILAGAGMGSSVQLCATSVRSSVSQKDVPIASALSVFAPFFGGFLAAGIAQNIFRAALEGRLLESFSSPETATILAAGAKGSVALVLGSMQETVMEAYNYAVSRAFILAAVAGGVGFLCTFGVEWRNIKKGNDQTEADAEKSDIRNKE